MGAQIKVSEDGRNMIFFKFTFCLLPLHIPATAVHCDKYFDLFFEKNVHLGEGNKTNNFKIENLSRKTVWNLLFAVIFGVKNDGCKGQLSSEWIHEVIASPKMQTENYKNFCPTKQTRIVALFWWFFGECRHFFWLWSFFV